MATPLSNIAEISSSQNNKYLTHNEAIRDLEALGIGAIENYSTSTPPVSPTTGDLYIVFPTGTGAWVGLDDELVQYTGTGWKSFTVPSGFTIFDKAQNLFIRWSGSAWVYLDNRFEVKNITLPYTLLATDNNKELIVASGTGTFSIPNASTGFKDYFQCKLSLDSATGDITIQRVDTTTTNLLFSGGSANNHIKATGTANIRMRTATSNVWKIEGDVEP